MADAWLFMIEVALRPLTKSCSEVLYHICQENMCRLSLQSFAEYEAIKWLLHDSVFCVYTFVQQLKNLEIIIGLFSVLGINYFIFYSPDLVNSCMLISWLCSL
jgi:hypothetical protein